MPPFPFPENSTAASATSPQWLSSNTTTEPPNGFKDAGSSSSSSSSSSPLMPPPLSLISPESESSSYSLDEHITDSADGPLVPPLYPLSESSWRSHSSHINNGNYHHPALFRRHDSEPLNAQALERQQQHHEQRYRHAKPFSIHTNNSHVHRRSIFSSECKQQATKLHLDHSNAGAVHHRTEESSLSSSTSDHPLTNRSLPKTPLHATPEEIKQLIAPPPDRLLQKPHFVALDHHAVLALHAGPQYNPTGDETFDSSCHEYHSLSAGDNLHLFLPENMPQPLKRFYHNGTRTQMGGVYPFMLTSCPPPPILRESSYNNNKGLTSSADRDHFSDDSSSEGNDNNTTLEERAFGTFNLTDTIRQRKKTIVTTNGKPFHTHNNLVPLPVVPNLSSIETSTDPDDHDKNRASRSPPTSSPSSHRVQFDPRVTVTEFHDGPRYWFSHKELEQMKCQAISTVRKYLIQHPDLISTYNEPRLDPITGTFRRKALFSIPVLNHEYKQSDDQPDTDLRETSEISTQRIHYQDHHARLHQVLTAADIHFKNILIACRNQLVSDLLKRSLQGLFPEATIITVSTGDAAMDIIDQQVPLDLVLAEARLEPAVATIKTAREETKNSQQQVRSSQHRGHSKSMDACTWQDEFHRVQIRALSTPPSIAKSPNSGEDTSDTTNEAVLSSLHRESQVATGAQLFDHLTRLETPGRFIEARRSACVMIGLTTVQRTAVDTPVLEQHGASWVWTLPPPSMDVALKHKLAIFLMQKRAAAKYGTAGEMITSSEYSCSN